MMILGIETSCDETAVSIVTDSASGEARILSNLVLSQLKQHKAFGGVVPEIAARAHIDHLHTLITAAINDAGVNFSDLDGVAATSGPGLIGGVMIGMVAGKALAAAHDIPFIAVNHLEGHALTARLTDDVAFPYLLLLISGGHTQILVAEDINTYRQWGTTLDDAAGECFDKSAKLMGLGFPGGPNLEKIAQTCINHARALERFSLPRPMMHRKELYFSFSGLKTAIRTHIDKLPPGDLKHNDIADMAYAFETAMADVMQERINKALVKFKDLYGTPAPSLILCGGVAANKAIRHALNKTATKNNAKLYAPPLYLCGDNAAMIAWAGLERLKAGLTNTLDFKARPRWPLDDNAPQKTGRGLA